MTGVRTTLFVLLFTAFLFGSIFVYRVHSTYFGGFGGGYDDHDDDDALLLRSEFGWLPERSVRSSSARTATGEEEEGRAKGGADHHLTEDGARRRKRKKKKKKEKERSPKRSVVAAAKGEAEAAVADHNNGDGDRNNNSSNRVYCMVPFIWTPSALDAYRAIRATWGQRCDVLRFFIDPIVGDHEVGFFNMTAKKWIADAGRANANPDPNANLTLPDGDDVVILHDMKRPWHTCDDEENEERDKPIGNCRNIFEKVWRTIVHVAEHSSEHAEWFVKVDADTYLFPENVGRYVESRGWSPSEHHYFGHVLNHRRDDRGVSIVAGGAVFFSRATLLAAASAFRNMPMDEGDEEEDGTCRDAYTGTEEVVTAVCLSGHPARIVAEPAVDAEGREEVSLYEIDIMLEYNRTEQGEWWFWEGKRRYPCHDDGDCLASLPLAFHHYKDPETFHRFEEEFHDEGGDVGKAHRWPNHDRTRGYIDRVRAATRATEEGERRRRAVEEESAARSGPRGGGETRAGRLGTRSVMKERKTSSATEEDRRRSAEEGPPSSANDTGRRRNDRVYCMVPFIWTPSAFEAYRSIRATWGQRCDVLRFFIDPIIGDDDVGHFDMSNPSGSIAAREAGMEMPDGDDVVVLSDMRRPWHASCPVEGRIEEFGNCRNIWEKIWRTIVRVAVGTTEEGGDPHHPSDAHLAEWFVKVDSDTYLFPENVGRYVRSRGWSPSDPHYFGHVLSHRKKERGVSVVAGGAVFYSRAALLAAADAFRNMPMDRGDEEEDGTCRDAYTGTEEMITAVCLKEHSNILADPAIDPYGREYVSLYEADDIVQYNRTDQGEWWYWKNKERFPCHDDGDCLAYLPLAFHHYKDPRALLDLEKEFYGSVARGEEEEDRSLIRTNDGRVAARRWPHFDLTQRYFERVRAAMRYAAERDDSRAPATATMSSNVARPPPLRNRLYCMVPFIWAPRYVHSYHAIRRTWGKRCDVLRFMIDPIVRIGGNQSAVDLRSEGRQIPEDVVVLHDVVRPWNACPDQEDGNCRNIWEKVWRAWVWVDSHGDADLAEWFVKVDADSYLFPENMKRYVAERGWSPDDHHYFGQTLMHREVTMVAGAAVFFSRATLRAAAQIFRGFESVTDAKYGFSRRPKCEDAFTDQEEVITSVCFKEHLGLDAYPTLDEMGQELVIIGEIEDVLMWNRTEQGEWWYWKNKPKRHPITGRDDMHHCCGDLPIAFHGYKDSQWFFKLENEFYSEEVSDQGDSWKSYKWRNPNETERYFVRVRNAMEKAASIGT